MNESPPDAHRCIGHGWGAGHVKFLVRRGADMEVTNDHGDTPAHIAASRLNVRCLRAFIDEGFDINIRGRLGRTVLHTAVEGRQIEVVEYLLLNAGGTSVINTHDSERLTLLLFAGPMGAMAAWGSDVRRRERRGMR